jgi:hypothetical protein
MRSGELDTMSTGNDAELRGLVDRLERLQTSLPQDTAEEIKASVDEACREAARIQATFAGQACLADEEGSASPRGEPGRLRKVGAYLVSLIVVAGVVVGVALLNRFGATGLANWAVIGILLVAMSVFGGWLYRLLTGSPRTGYWYVTAFFVGLPMLVISGCIATPI